MSSYIRYAFSINQTSLARRWCNKFKSGEKKKEIEKSCEIEASTVLPTTPQGEEGTNARHSNKKKQLWSGLLLLEPLFFDTVEGWLTDAISRCGTAAADASRALLTHCGRCCPSIHPGGGQGKVTPPAVPPIAGKRRETLSVEPVNQLYPKVALWNHLLGHGSTQRRVLYVLV